MSSPATKRPRKLHNTSTFHATGEFYELLIRTKAEDLKTRENVVFVAQKTDRIVDVWKGLVRHGFLSCPVLNDADTEYCGFVDVSDILNYVMEHFGRQKLESLDDFWKMVDEEDDFRTRTIGDLQLSSYVSVRKGYSLFAAIEILARESGVHRVPVLGTNNKLWGVLTQSAVAQFVFDNVALLGDKRNAPVSSFATMGAEKLILCDADDMAADAFRSMQQAGVQGVGVTENGALLGTLSVRDLKTLSTDAGLMWKLHTKLRDFLRSAQIADGSEERPTKVLTVNSTATLEQVLDLLSTNKIHRVFVADADNKPVGVCSLKDVLLELVTVHE